MTFDFQCSDVLNTNSGMLLFVVLLRTWYLSTHGVFLQICQYRSLLRLIDHINGYSDFGFFTLTFLSCFQDNENVSDIASFPHSPL